MTSTPDESDLSVAKYIIDALHARGVYNPLPSDSSADEIRDAAVAEVARAVAAYREGVESLWRSCVFEVWFHSNNQTMALEQPYEGMLHESLDDNIGGREPHDHPTKQT